MNEVLTIGKAIGDESRLRALVMLRGGELCLCQLIDVLALSPSTVSKHMSILHGAGLIERRKDGRWHYYRLAERSGSPAVRAALRWVGAHAQDHATLERDAKKLCCTKRRQPEELTSCYSGK